MRKILALLLTLALGAPALGQTFPLNNLPLGKGPGKQGWTAVAPGADGTCLVVVAGVPTFSSCFSGLTGAALTRTNDTNITLTLGGSPSTALVNAVSLTLGWAGTLDYTRGGCNAATQVACRNNIFPTPSAAGDIAYWNGTAWVILAGNTTSTKFLQQTSAGVPSWVAAPGTGTVTNVATSGLATGGPITSTGTVTVTAATKSDQQTGTSAVVAVTPSQAQSHDSAIKAWCVWNGTTAGTNACALGSYNVTSVTRNGTGSYNINFTTAFASTSYGCVAMSNVTTNGYMEGDNTGASTASVFRVYSIAGSTTTLADAPSAQIMCFGRQ